MKARTLFLRFKKPGYVKRPIDPGHSFSTFAEAQVLATIPCTRVAARGGVLWAKMPDQKKMTCIAMLSTSRAASYNSTYRSGPERWRLTTDGAELLGLSRGHGYVIWEVL